MIELTETDKKYQDIKDDLVAEIAELDIKLTQTNEKNATLNKMAEVLFNLKSDDPNSRKLARYDFSKLNMTESISIEQVNKEIVMVQQDFKLYVNDYEKSTKRLEKFLKILNFDNGVDKQFDEEISL